LVDEVLNEGASRSMVVDEGELAISTALGAIVTGARETELDGGLKSHYCQLIESYMNGFYDFTGKGKKSSHQPKAEDTNQEKLYLLHMDLYGPMRVESSNGKKYILVIVDDYARFTWVKFLRSKDEGPAAIIKCIKNIQVRLNATVCDIRTNNGTEFVN
nr:hypothetical protein [Tanacetum cinerariifolium]